MLVSYTFFPITPMLTISIDNELNETAISTVSAYTGVHHTYLAAIECLSVLISINVGLPRSTIPSISYYSSATFISH